MQLERDVVPVVLVFATNKNFNGSTAQSVSIFYWLGRLAKATVIDPDGSASRPYLFEAVISFLIYDFTLGY